MFTLSDHLWALTVHRVLSLSETQLTRVPPLCVSTANATSEFDKKAEGFPPVLSNQYLYTALHLDAGRPKGRFRRSPLSPDSNDILLLSPSDPNSWTKTGFGPPPDCSQASTSPGMDHQASGLMTVTCASLTHHASPIAGLRVLGFPTAALLKSLASPRSLTPSLVLQDVRCDADPVSSNKLQRPSTLPRRISPSPISFRRYCTPY